MTTNPNTSLLRGVDALDFDVSAYPGEPPRMVAVHARPPSDTAGYEAMVAASQLSAILCLGSGPLAAPEAVYAADLQRQTLAATAVDQTEILRRYREALGDALHAYLAGHEAERLAELLAWYEEDRKKKDG